MLLSKIADTPWIWRRGLRQLRDAEDRIAELETEVETYRQQAERAEQWLHKVYMEIEDRFLRQGEDSRDTPQRSQRTNRH